METRKQKQTQNAEFQPSEMNGIRMAVIEHRPKGGHEWFVWTIYDNAHEIEAGFLRVRCKSLARHYPKAEFRYRRGTLTLETSDKCVIFRSE